MHGQQNIMFLKFPNSVIQVKNVVCCMAFVCTTWAKLCGIDAIYYVDFL
jgi:hypothetical protein